jgi:predicted nucleotidyltransferase
MEDFKMECIVCRDDVVEVIIDSLRPLDAARAMWEQGAASFGRVDEYSDIDLCIISRDDGVEAVFGAVERALEKRFGISDRFRLPEPTWHGHSQAFYWLNGASKFLFVDMAVEKSSAKNRFLEYAMHGPPVVRMDKDGIISDDTPPAKETAKKLAARLESLKTTFRLFQVEVEKELKRGNGLEALAFYNGMTLRPLVEALRIKHCPHRAQFHTRYAYYDLPPAVWKRLEGLMFVSDAASIAGKRAEAERWFWRTVESIDVRGLAKALERGAAPPGKANARSK